MKRAGNLWEKILARDNLRLGYWKALRGKRDKHDACQFGDNLETNLAEMETQLRDGTILLGVCHQFTIHDPKERLITAPCFRERVLHHAIMNICEPVFERWLIHDSYACRRGKGRVAAVQRAQHFAARHTYFLKMDIQKYFASISHDLLYAKLCRLFKDRPLLELFHRILTSYETNDRGLPIGSLTSQHFANFYLGHLDRFVKEHLHASGYLRYMDDFAVWHDKTQTLCRWQGKIAAFLHDHLNLDLKPNAYINRTTHGMDWLGCRVFRHHTTLNRRSRRRFRLKLQTLERAHANGELDESELQRRAQPLVAFTRAGGVSSWRFRRRVLQQLAGKQP